jgi:pimeloyl-ACP methyl ester carboxylesterase
MLVEKSFDTGEVVLNYAEGPPNGPPFLFIHGVTGYWKAIQLLAPSLFLTWQIYSPDLRGHGKSGRATDYSAKASVRDLVKLIDEVIIEPPVIFGHSFGGIVGTMLAGMYPHKVKALIIGDIPGNTNHCIRSFFKKSSGDWSSLRDQIQSGDYARDWSFRHKYTDAEVLTPWAECGENDGAYQNFLDGYDTDVLYPSIECPVLLLMGNPELGSFMSDFDVEHAKDLIQDLAYVRLEDVGHGLFLENRESVIAAMTPFLFSLD